MDEVDQLSVVVVGTGAAGLMAAIHAAAGTRPVLLLEGSARPGQKILISGGGRCNVLPREALHTDFISDSSPNLVRKVLAAWPLAKVRRFFEADLGVLLKLEAETGKLFPASDRARTVLDALMTAYVQRGGRVCTATRVTDLRRSDDCWAVQLASGETIRAERVILATGGLSVPATGSDGVGLRIARRAWPCHRPHLSRARAADGQQSRTPGAGGRVDAGAGVGSGRRTKDKRSREAFHGRRSSVVGRLVPRRLPLHSPRLQRASGAQRVACGDARDGGWRRAADASRPVVRPRRGRMGRAAARRFRSGVAAAAPPSAGAAGRAALDRNRPGRRGSLTASSRRPGAVGGGADALTRCPGRARKATKLPK